MSRFLATLPLGALIAASASAAELDKLEGRYGFNWFSDPDKAVCARIDDKLIRTFGSPSYTCDLTPNTSTASFAPAVHCRRKDGRAEYLIFATRAACEKERETQVSNGT
jgi:hypothetical protein